jgi:hypothetical protein
LFDALEEKLISQNGVAFAKNVHYLSHDPNLGFLRWSDASVFKQEHKELSTNNLEGFWNAPKKRLFEWLCRERYQIFYRDEFVLDGRPSAMFPE